jgi:hypothetical protein
MTEKPVKKHKTTSPRQVVQDAVSNKLRAYYEEISRQDIPQRHLDLLNALDKVGDRED